MTALLILAFVAIDPSAWDFSVDVRWNVLRVVVVAGVLGMVNKARNRREG